MRFRGEVEGIELMVYACMRTDAWHMNSLVPLWERFLRKGKVEGTRGNERVGTDSESGCE